VGVSASDCDYYNIDFLPGIISLRGPEASMRGALSSVLVPVLFVSLSLPFFSQVTGIIKAFTDPTGALVANMTVNTTHKATSLTSLAGNRASSLGMCNFEQRSHHRQP
jgi:hypothetical protein